MKHERAIIMGLAYFIGFVTSFIGYGLATDSEYLAPLVVAPASTQMASIPAAVTAQKVAIAEPTVSISATTPDYSGDLYMSVGEEKRLISPAISEEFGIEFGHSLVTQALLSPDESKLYYCIISTVSENECLPYIYDWEVNAIFPVTVSNPAIETNFVSLPTSWSDDGRLLIGTLSSADSITPWKL